ncbi:MAG: hypothetical protein ACOCRK_09230 [bacterium]
MSNYNINNFVSIPVPGDKLDPAIRIYNKNGDHVFSFEPYITYFTQKNKYIYVIIQNNVKYQNTLDFNSESEAKNALSKLNKVKKIYLDNAQQSNSSYNKQEIDENFYNKIEIDGNFYTQDEINENFYTQDEIDSKIGSSDFSGITYSGSSLINIGGIEQGDIFNNISMQDMWFKLLNPYQSPSVDLNSDLPSTIEVGTTLNSLYNFTWSSNNDSNIDGTLTLNGPSNNITGLTSDGNTGLTINIQKTNQNSENWTISGTDTKENNFSDSETVYWRYKVFYGTYSGTSISDSDILNLNSEFSTDRYKTWTQDGNGEYIYYIYPSSFGDVSSGNAPFEINNLPNTAFTKEVRDIILSTGISVEYIIYRTDDVQNGTGIKIEKL